MTPQEAIKNIDDILDSPYLCDESIDYQLTTDDIECLEKAKEALEKQIPKKPYKIKEHKQNDYYCAICKCYLGDEMELQNACLQPKYCEHCGQKLSWESDTE